MRKIELYNLRYDLAEKINMCLKNKRKKAEMLKLLELYELYVVTSYILGLIAMTSDDDILEVSMCSKN